MSIDAENKAMPRLEGKGGKAAVREPLPEMSRGMVFVLTYWQTG